MSCGSGGCGGGFATGGGSYGKHDTDPIEVNGVGGCLAFVVFFLLIVGGVAIATSADGALPPVEGHQVEVRQ